MLYANTASIYHLEKGVILKYTIIEALKLRKNNLLPI